MTVFSKVGVLGRRSSESTMYSLDRLISYLHKQNIEVFIDEESAQIFTDRDLPVKTRAELATICDLIIVVGGDGSMLAAARAFAGHDIKLLGINRGRLGFLTDISPEQIEYKVGEVLEGEFAEEQRFLLSCGVYRDGERVSEALALNDVVLHPGKFIRMIEFELFVDDQFVCRQRADGLIVSTPTGSTAYALSVGGPIMTPCLDAIVVVPMNPHTLSSRPIVVPGDVKIKIVVSNSNPLNPHISCDGQTQIVSQPNDIIFVDQSSQKLNLIHPKNHNFMKPADLSLVGSVRQEISSNVDFSRRRSRGFRFRYHW